MLMGMGTGRDRAGIKHKVQSLLLPYLENIGRDLQKPDPLCADGEGDRGGRLEVTGAGAGVRIPSVALGNRQHFRDRSMRS
jgi:hypothetical protein